MKILVEGVQNSDLVDRLQQFALAHPEQEIEVTLLYLSRGVAQGS